MMILLMNDLWWSWSLMMQKRKAAIPIEMAKSRWKEYLCKKSKLGENFDDDYDDDNDYENFDQDDNIDNRI